VITHNQEKMMRSRKQIWTFAIVSLALFMAMLDNLVVITALPSIRKALGASVSDLEWTVNAYTLAFAVLMMTGAALGDRFGRKRIFIVGVSLFTLGSAFSALSSTTLQLEIARAIQGMGAAFLTPLTLTILTRVFPPERRAAVIGLWSGVAGLGLAIGPLVGGAVVNGLPWSTIFWLNVPTGAIVIVLAATRLEESWGDRQPLDVPGLVLAAGGLLGITFGLIRGNALGWTSATIIASLAAGVILLVSFLAWERSTPTPMLNLLLFRSAGFSAANASGFMMSAGMFGSIFFLTLYVQQVLGASPLEAGLRTMPWTGTIMIVAPIAGILAGRFGPRWIVVTGLVLQALALLWIAGIATTTTPYNALLFPFVIGGIGMGLSYAPLAEAVMSTVLPNQQGQASGAHNSIRELGGVFGVAVLGAIFQHLVTTPTHFMDGFRAALYAGVVIVLVGAVAGVALPRTQSEQVVAGAPSLAGTEA
jgi:EmrB/QacA subfamily drug resistance transporter